MRNTPEALDFIKTAGTQGVRAAVELRDGPWGDYSQARPERRPDPSHIVEPYVDLARLTNSETITPMITRPPPTTRLMFSH